MNILYYVPETDHSSIGDAIESAGLTHIVQVRSGRMVDADAQLCHGGPDGKSGMIVNPRTMPHGETQDGLYRPDSQTWECEPSGRYWLGTSNTFPPQPCDLERPKMISGDSVTLGDGNSWVVPQAVQWPEKATRFPAVLRLRDGRWQRDPVARYRGLCELAEILLGEIADDGTVKRDDSWLIEQCAEILGVNYRIGPIECSVLGLFTTGDVGSIGDIIRAFTGIGELERIMEAVNESKKADGPASIPAGNGLSVGAMG